MKNLETFGTDQRLMILIIDDVRINQEVLIAFLEDDYQIKIASNSLSTLEIAQCYPYPDLCPKWTVMKSAEGCRKTHTPLIYP